MDKANEIVNRNYKLFTDKSFIQSYQLINSGKPIATSLNSETFLIQKNIENDNYIYAFKII